MLKKSLPVVFLLAGLGCSGSPPRPNIIYIMTDDHATQMMSAYGSTRASTPNLDRIAREGMLFRNAFCTNSLCAPSRATLLTGLYSHKNGQLSNQEIFDGIQSTFPKLLQQAGYQTALVGKWHLRSEPTGFDYWNILPGQGDYRNPDLIEMGERKSHQGYVTDIITDLAMDWIRNRDPERPFALLYHHKAPHARWIPSEEHEQLFEDEDIAAPETFEDDFSRRAEPIQLATNRLVPGLLRRYRQWGPQFGKVVPEELESEASRDWMYQAYIKDYKRVMVSVDENVGRLLDFLEREGLSHDTMVIYTSDNGKFVGDHFMFDKRLMYEETLRIPLAVRYPRGIQPGRETEAFSLNLDYAPTILDYAGVDIPQHMQGRSLRPLLQGSTPDDWREMIYYQYHEPPAAHNVATHYGVRTARYKLIHYSDDYGGPEAWELIDLEEDPLEYVNFYDDSAYEDTVRGLKEQLRQLREQFEVPK